MNFYMYQSSPSGGEIDIPPLTFLHLRSNDYRRGYRMWNHIVVALLQGSDVSGLISIVERVKWRVLMKVILSILSLGCAHSLSRFYYWYPVIIVGSAFFLVWLLYLFTPNLEVLKHFSFFICDRVFIYVYALD